MERYRNCGAVFRARPEVLWRDRAAGGSSRVQMFAGGNRGYMGGENPLWRCTYSKARFNSAASHRQTMTDAL